MRGRKPKPTYLRVLDGNAGRRPTNADEPQPAGALEDSPPPEWLSDDQKAGWRYAMKHAPAGLLKPLDQSVLVVWVCAESVHAEAAQQVARLGSLIKSKEGTPYQNPFLSIMNKQAAIMLKATGELGFSPSSRSRVKVDPKKPAKDSPFGQLKSIADD